MRAKTIFSQLSFLVVIEVVSWHESKITRPAKFNLDKFIVVDESQGTQFKNIYITNDVIKLSSHMLKNLHVNREVANVSFPYLIQWH